MSEEEKKSAENDQPQSVNEQITDSVSVTNAINVGEHPAFVYSQVYQAAAHSTAIMFENSINNQNNQNILGQAATTQGIMQIYNMSTLAAGGAHRYNFRLQPSSDKDNDQKDDSKN